MTDAATPVLVEVVLLGVRPTSTGVEELGFRTVCEPLSAGTEPDVVARKTSRLPVDESALLHSTSWRFDDGQVVLTYVALPDPDPDAPRHRIAASVAQCDDAAHPSPSVAVAEVAAHACRHLAFLAATDSEVRAALRRHPAIVRLLRRHQPEPAGELTTN
jgi:hypothetical protein